MTEAEKDNPGEKPETSRDAGLAARQGAHRLIAAVLRHKRALDEAFAEEATSGPLAKLAPADRGFARAIASATIRHLGEIDLIIKRLLNKKLPPRAGLTQTILRAAIAEILFLDVKPHAAVDLAVEAANRDNDAQHFKSLVNALLRRLLREGDAAREGIDGERAALPAWLWKSWIGTYGEIKTREIIRAQFPEPPLDLSVKDETRLDEWATRLDAKILPTGTLRLEASGRVENLDGFDEGAWWVQDAAAALPARILDAQPGENVLDMCAAPGGKTLQLAAAGAEVTALDISEARLKTVTENLARTGLSARLVTGDAREHQGQYQAILLDAPCSATGTIRRHPDLPHIKQVRELDALVPLQSQMLDHAWTMLAPGGRLVFCTCSLLPEEGEGQITGALTRLEGVSIDRQALDRPGIDPAWISAEGGLRLRPDYWADAGGMDGFYMACLRKSG